MLLIDDEGFIVTAEEWHYHKALGEMSAAPSTPHENDDDKSAVVFLPPTYDGAQSNIPSVAVLAGRPDALALLLAVFV